MLDPDTDCNQHSVQALGRADFLVPIKDVAKRSIAIHPRLPLAANVNALGQLVVYRLSVMELLWTVSVSAEIVDFCWAGDGKAIVVIAGNNKLIEYGVEGGKIVREMSLPLHSGKCSLSAASDGIDLINGNKIRIIYPGSDLYADVNIPVPFDSKLHVFDNVIVAAYTDDSGLHAVHFNVQCNSDINQVRHSYSQYESKKSEFDKFGKTLGSLVRTVTSWQDSAQLRHINKHNVLQFIIRGEDAVIRDIVELERLEMLMKSAVEECCALVNCGQAEGSIQRISKSISLMTKFLRGPDGLELMSMKTADVIEAISICCTDVSALADDWNGKMMRELQLLETENRSLCGQLSVHPLRAFENVVADGKYLDICMFDGFIYMAVLTDDSSLAVYKSDEEIIHMHPVNAKAIQLLSPTSILLQREDGSVWIAALNGRAERLGVSVDSINQVSFANGHLVVINRNSLYYFEFAIRNR